MSSQTSPSIARRLGVAFHTHQRLIVVVWLAILVLAAPFAMRRSSHLRTGGYVVPGSQSSNVASVLKREFPQASPTAFAVLLWPHTGATTSAFSAAIVRVQRAVHGISGVTLPSQARELANFASGLDEPVVMPLVIDVNEGRTQEIAETLQRRLNLGRTSNDAVEVHLLGEAAIRAGLAETSKRQLASAEKIGFPVVLVVLLAIFGSLAAASLPLALGITTVVVTGALIYMLSLVVELSVFITNTASLLGIGVAVDYSLIVLARVRQELAAGADMTEARRVARKTSGTAVIFSGVTVIVSLTGLFVMPNNTIRSMALGAILAVAVSVAASMTLLPGLIALLGARRLSANRLAIGWLRGAGTRGSHGAWDRWTQIVTRRPIVTIIIVSSLLIVFCIPALAMRTSTSALQQLSAGNETRTGFSEAAKLIGPGALGPADVIVHAQAPVSKPRLDAWIGRLRLVAGRLPEVRRIGATHLSHNGRYGFFTVVPTVDPESAAATQLIQHLRDSLSATVAGTEVSAMVGGTPGIQLDEQQGIARRMWVVIVTVLLLAFFVLMIMLRSVVLPLKAILMNLLSVGAAYGVMVTVFQWGWSDAFLGYRSLGHLNTLTPPLVLAIVFGLSMDYEVFLLSRVKERWLACGDSRRAVAEGLSASARTISSAALILVCVAAVFIGTGMPAIKELGLGVAVAVGIDATLIRLVLVPATMAVLGDWNWWWPRPLARLLPAHADSASATSA